MLVAAVLVALVVAPFEMTLRVWGTSGAVTGPSLKTRKSFEAAYERFQGWLSWKTPPPWQLRAEVTQPPTNSLVVNALVRQGLDPSRQRLDRERFGIYAQELGGTGLLLVVLLVVAFRFRRSRVFVPSLAVLTALDLLVLGHALRPVETAPLRPFTAQSPVLARLAAEPRGTRVLSSLGNWPMAFGVAALPPYRTLDRPVLGWLPGWAGANDPLDPEWMRTILAAHRDCGAGLRVVEPRAVGDPVIAAWPGRVERIRDPQLAAWLYGAAALKSRSTPSNTFVLLRSPGAPVPRVVSRRAGCHRRTQDRIHHGLGPV